MDATDETLNPSASVDSIWRLKPWWCQPWSILLTGLTAVAFSWFWLHMLWLTTLVGGAVLAWWTLFLILVPRAWKKAINSEAMAE